HRWATSQARGGLFAHSSSRSALPPHRIPPHRQVAKAEGEGRAPRASTAERYPRVPPRCVPGARVPRFARRRSQACREAPPRSPTRVLARWLSLSASGAGGGAQGWAGADRRRLRSSRSGSSPVAPGCVGEQRFQETVYVVLRGLDVRLEPVLSQRGARDGADRDGPGACCQWRPTGLPEEANAGGRGERDVVGGPGLLQGVLGRRLGDRLV